MESLGKYLKRERELRNISLREIAKNIKVREPLLVAMEEDQYHLLPSTTYIKGFLIAYARYVGLDPKDVLLRYESFIKGEPGSPIKIPSKKKISWNKKHLYVIGGVILVSLIASYLFYPSKPPSELIAVKPEAEKNLPPLSLPQIAGTLSTEEKKPLVLEFKALEKTWVRIQADGQLKQEARLNPGEEGSSQALKEINLSTGNAGGLELRVNGKSLGKLGKSGETLTLIFTPQGVKIKRPEKTKTP